MTNRRLSGMNWAGIAFFALVIAALLALYAPHSWGASGPQGMAIVATLIVIFAAPVLAIIYPGKLEDTKARAIRAGRRKERLRGQLTSHRPSSSSEPVFRDQIRVPTKAKLYARVAVIVMGATWSLAWIYVAWDGAAPGRARTESAWFALILAFLPVLIWLGWDPGARAGARRGRRYWRLGRRAKEPRP